MLTVGSLFSGAGLCDLGFHRAGFSHRFFCEIDPYCRSILTRHWPGVPIYGDIRGALAAELPEADVLVGGFPCQDVSCGGARAGITQETRSGLWYEYKRLIREMRPKYAVIENVKGLLSKGMEVVLQDLSSIGYDAEWQSVPAAALGAPHLRERVFIVAYPHGDNAFGKHRVYMPNEGNMGQNIKPGSLLDWLGIRIDRTRKEAIRQAYRNAVLCRVDDGAAGGLDDAGRTEPCRPGVPFVTPDVYKQWKPRLKALGNGVLPQQTYYVACCILRAEGLPVPEGIDL